MIEAAFAMLLLAVCLLAFGGGVALLARWIADRQVGKVLEEISAMSESGALGAIPVDRALVCSEIECRTVYAAGGGRQCPRCGCQGWPLNTWLQEKQGPKRA